MDRFYLSQGLWLVAAACIFVVLPFKSYFVRVIVGAAPYFKIITKEIIVSTRKTMVFYLHMAAGGNDYRLLFLFLSVSGCYWETASFFLETALVSVPSDSADCV